MGERQRDLSDSSGMAKTMTSDVIRKDEVLCGSGDSITLLLNPHFAVEWINSYQSFQHKNDIMMMFVRMINLCIYYLLSIPGMMMYVRMLNDHFGYKKM